MIDTLLPIIREYLIWIGIGLNLLTAFIILGMRFYPVLKSKLKIRRLWKREVKFALYHKRSKLSVVDWILGFACIIMIIIPFAFLVFTLMSIRENMND